MSAHSVYTFVLPLETVKQEIWLWGEKCELKSLFSFFSQSNGRKATGAQRRERSVPCNHAKAPVSAHFY